MSAAELIAAVKGGDVEAVRALVASDPSLAETMDEQGMPAVRLALYQQRRDVVDALLEAGPRLQDADVAAVGDIPETPMRPCSETTTRLQHAAMMPPPPKAPARPPIKAITATPAARASKMARMISDTANSPAFASCKRTPPVSNSNRTGHGPVCASRAARSNPTSFAP